MSDLVQCKTVTFLGHSFVRRLSEFVNSHSDFHNLGLPTSLFHVRFLGVGGLKLRDSRFRSLLSSVGNSWLVIIFASIYIKLKKTNVQ